MRKTTLAEWEKKYVAGPIEPFNSRYQMFTRPMWDPEIKDLLDNWSIAGTAQDKNGFTLEDQALRWGSNAGTAVTRPAPPPGAGGWAWSRASSSNSIPSPGPSGGNR